VQLAGDGAPLLLLRLQKLSRKCPGLRLQPHRAANGESGNDGAKHAHQSQLRGKRPAKAGIERIELDLPRFPLAVERGGDRIRQVQHDSAALCHLLTKPGVHTRRGAARRHFIHKVEQAEPRDHLSAERRGFGGAELAQRIVPKGRQRFG
jgi:hypothetical protein